MSSLKQLVADLHKPFSGMLEENPEIKWAEVSDYEIPKDTRNDRQIARDEARDEIINNHKHD